MKISNAIKACVSFSALVLLTACAAQNSTVRLPDGSVAINISCDGSAGGINYCFERAGKSCGASGYTIVDETGAVISRGFAGSSETDSESLVRVQSMVIDQSSMLIKCDS